MSPELERHLMEMGVVSASPLEQLEGVVDPRHKCLAKGYFNDPRDENGEVPY
jgi:hypothetical protein